MYNHLQEAEMIFVIFYIEIWGEICFNNRRERNVSDAQRLVITGVINGGSSQETL